ncbi:MarR family winged helix-turn-helix transcriptional regulator [Gracilibacillus alcaliphilus]|uniref:MarR family winged helix-turn-helix transcriptional regulator n=1 Tax=Gracilibacillus alcaliphilus TaxID=1401441 RepID=UPI00195C1796|nr:MarR family transcriptional regulator [Gracilibacillus alcaliphilus]MBM7677484.1 DNA-binding MarR family transcriptional regulator [Gracilibacillus alcaliphilus]
MENSSLFHKMVAFSAAVHQTTHEWTQTVRPAALSPVQYKILEYIAVHPTATPSEINDCMHMSMPNTSRELKHLTEKHLIKKSTNTNDRRKHYIQLSDQGEKIMTEVFASIENHFLARMQNNTSEDLAKVEDAIDLLQEKIFYDKQRKRP